MDAIYSATALRDRPKEVKQAARERLVRITEHGKGAYIFCSEAVFESEIQQAVDRALYAQRAQDAVMAGKTAIEQGDYLVGIDAGKAAVAALRGSR